MSNHTKSSTVPQKIGQEAEQEMPEVQMAEIIPWPDVGKLMAKKPREKKRVRLEGKFLYHRGKKVPILQFQKSGYDKLLKLLVKEIS